MPLVSFDALPRKSIKKTLVCSTAAVRCQHVKAKAHFSGWTLIVTPV